MNENIRKKISEALDLAYSLGKMSETKEIAISPKRWFDMILDSIELVMMREEQCPPVPIKTEEVNNDGLTFAYTGVGCEDDCADCLCSTCKYDCAENHMDGFKCRSGEYISGCSNHINKEFSWLPFKSKSSDGFDGCEACLCSRCIYDCAEGCGHICEDVNKIVGTCSNFKEK